MHKCCITTSVLNVEEGFELSGASSERKDACDSLLPSLLEIFQTKVLDVANSNISKHLGQLDNESRISDVEFDMLLKQTVLCSATEPGFVSPHQVVPVNHSLGMWVYRPAGVSDGILFVKGGPVKDANNIQPWSRYAH